MTQRGPRAVAALGVAAGLLAGLVACDDGDGGGDLAAFCDAVEALQAEDPFAELVVASPGEMRDAFDQLAEGVDRIAATAPSEARTQARAYRSSVDELIDQLRGAGFDPRHVDSLDYRRAVADHDEAATSVENAAAAICP